MKNFWATLFLTMLIMTAGVSIMNPADAENARSHYEGNKNRIRQHHGNFNRGRSKYEESRVLYYVPSYHPRYDQIYYRPWFREDVAIPTFRVGAILPHYARYKEPPHSVVAILPPVERGTRYVQVDNDIYLMSEDSRKILDAVVLISAANR